MLKNRLDAAQPLAHALIAYRGQHPLILAIPRGAVPMGQWIARQLVGESKASAPTWACAKVVMVAAEGADLQGTVHLKVRGNSADFKFLGAGSIAGTQAHKLGHFEYRRAHTGDVQPTFKVCKNIGEHRDLSSSALNRPNSFQPSFRKACTALWLMLALMLQAAQEVGMELQALVQAQMKTKFSAPVLERVKVLFTPSCWPRTSW